MRRHVALLVAVLVVALAAPAAAQTIPHEPTRPVDRVEDFVYTYPHQQTTALTCDGYLDSTTSRITTATAGTINQIGVHSQRWEIRWGGELIDGPDRISPTEHVNTELIVMSSGMFDGRGVFRGQLEWDVTFRHWNAPAGVGNGMFEGVQANQYRFLDKPGLWALVSKSTGIESSVFTSTVCMIDARLSTLVWGPVAPQVWLGGSL